MIFKTPEEIETLSTLDFHSEVAKCYILITKKRKKPTDTYVSILHRIFKETNSPRAGTIDSEIEDTSAGGSWNKLKPIFIEVCAQYMKDNNIPESYETQ